MTFISTRNICFFYQDAILGLVQKFNFDELDASDDGLFRYTLTQYKIDEDNKIFRKEIDNEVYLVQEHYEGIIEDIVSKKENNQKSLNITLYTMEKTGERLIDLDGFPKGVQKALDDLEEAIYL